MGVWREANHPTEEKNMVSRTTQNQASDE